MNKCEKESITMRTRLLATPTFYNIYIYIYVNDRRGHGIIVLELECAPQIKLLVGFNY